MRFLSLSVNYLGLGLLYFLSILPLCINHAIGDGLGWLASKLPIERNRVIAINLEKCFPDLSSLERQRILQKNWRLFGRSMCERAYLWLGSKRQVRQLVHVKSAIKLDDGKPRIFIGMHLMGIEAGSIALSLHMEELGVKKPTTLYVRMKNDFFETRIKNWRERFGAVLLIRLQSSRDLLRSLKNGQLVIISPDMDLGIQDSIFVPFFGISTCTVTSVSRLALITQAEVCTMTTTLNPDGRSYTCEISPPWENFPTDNLIQDTTRLNQHFEAMITPRISEYYWIHKRFKNRPDQQPRFY